jgi:hypothetical protein
VNERPERQAGRFPVRTMPPELSTAALQGPGTGACNSGTRWEGSLTHRPDTPVGGEAGGPTRTERFHFVVRSAHGGRIEGAILSLDVRTQLQLSSTRRISVGSTVFGLTSCV